MQLETEKERKIYLQYRGGSAIKIKIKRRDALGTPKVVPGGEQRVEVEYVEGKNREWRGLAFIRTNVGEI